MLELWARKGYQFGNTGVAHFSIQIQVENFTIKTIRFTGRPSLEDAAYKEYCERFFSGKEDYTYKQGSHNRRHIISVQLFKHFYEKQCAGKNLTDEELKLTNNNTFIDASTTKPNLIVEQIKTCYNSIYALAILEAIEQACNSLDNVFVGPKTENEGGGELIRFLDGQIRATAQNGKFEPIVEPLFYQTDAKFIAYLQDDQALKKFLIPLNKNKKDISTPHFHFVINTIDELYQALHHAHIDYGVLNNSQGVDKLNANITIKRGVAMLVNYYKPHVTIQPQLFEIKQSKQPTMGKYLVPNERAILRRNKKQENTQQTAFRQDSPVVAKTERPIIEEADALQPQKVAKTSHAYPLNRLTKY